LGSAGHAGGEFLNASIDFSREQLTEIKAKREPGISDIVEAYSKLLEKKSGKLLVLIDEAGSLDKDFFKDGGGASLFETLMNQLRTCEFVRTKIAVYPNSFSDVLVETRYGDFVTLTEHVENDLSYKSFRSKVVSLVERYVQTVTGHGWHAESLFEMTGLGDALEQLIYGSGGNMRRLVNLELLL
jgi:DNA polymerase III delta prime subunit